MKRNKTVMDSHTHLYASADGNPFGGFSAMDRFFRERALRGLCVNALGDPDHGGMVQNVTAALYKLHNPQAYASGGFVYPSVPVEPPLPQGMDALTQYKELMEIGFDGIKILYKPTVQKKLSLPADAPFYEDMFAAAEKDATPFVWHVADPPFFWDPGHVGAWSYGDGSYPSFETMLRQVFAVLEKHPRLTVSFAHFLFFSHRPQVLEQIFDRYPHVCIDVTPGTEMYGAFAERPDFYRSFLEKHADRILYGTDAEPPENPDCEGLADAVLRALTTEDEVVIWGLKTKGLALSDKACEKILAGNFLRLFGQTPKPVNVAALLRYIEKYEHLIADDVAKRYILTEAARLA